MKLSCFCSDVVLETRVLVSRRLEQKVLVLKQSLCLGLASEKIMRSWSCLGLAIQSLGLGLEISLIYTSGFLLRSHEVYVVSMVKVLISC